MALMKMWCESPQDPLLEGPGRVPEEPSAVRVVWPVRMVESQLLELVQQLGVGKELVVP